MRLIIELLTRDAHTGDARDDSYIALASYEGDLLSKAGVGAGSTHRQAAQEAINSLFSRRDAEAATNEPFILRDASITLHASHPALAGAGSLLDHRVETEQRNIIAFLRESIAAIPKPHLSMEYRDAQGTETVREIVALEITQTHPPGGFLEDRYLKAIDLDKDEPRTFRLDRITRLELAA